MVMLSKDSMRIINGPGDYFRVALPLACQEVKLSKRSTVARAISKRTNRSSINSY